VPLAVAKSLWDETMSEGVRLLADPIVEVSPSRAAE
jgi:hypothetical protein